MLIILLLQQMFFFKFGELNHSKLQINGNGAMSYTTLENSEPDQSSILISWSSARYLPMFKKKKTN